MLRPGCIPVTCGTMMCNLPFYTHQSRSSSSGASSRFGGFLPLFITQPVTHPDAMYLSPAATLTILRSSALPAQSQCSVDTPIATIIQLTTNTVTMYSLRSCPPFQNSVCCLSGFNVLHTGGKGLWKQVFTCWEHFRLWQKVPPMFPPDTFHSHFKCNLNICIQCDHQ